MCPSYQSRSHPYPKTLLIFSVHTGNWIFFNNVMTMEFYYKKKKKILVVPTLLPGVRTCLQLGISQTFPCYSEQEVYLNKVTFPEPELLHYINMGIKGRLMRSPFPSPINFFLSCLGFFVVCLFVFLHRMSTSPRPLKWKIHEDQNYQFCSLLYL